MDGDRKRIKEVPTEIIRHHSKYKIREKSMCSNVYRRGTCTVRKVKRIPQNHSSSKRKITFNCWKRKY